MAGANEGKRKGILPRIPDISKKPAPFPGSTGAASQKSQRQADRENRKSMRRERKDDTF